MHPVAQTFLRRFIHVSTAIEAKDIDAERRRQRSNGTIGAGKKCGDQGNHENDLHHGGEVAQHHSRENLVARFCHTDDRCIEGQQSTEVEEQQHHTQHDDA